MLRPPKRLTSRKIVYIRLAHYPVARRQVTTRAQTSVDWLPLQVQTHFSLRRRMLTVPASLGHMTILSVFRQVRPVPKLEYESVKPEEGNGLVPFPSFFLLSTNFCAWK